jgi:hypothetical protein
MAENTGFVACFLKGVVEKKSYRKLISDLYFVYEAMEEEIERLVNEEHPVIKPIGFNHYSGKKLLKTILNFILVIIGRMKLIFLTQQKNTLKEFERSQKNHQSYWLVTTTLAI